MDEKINAQHYQLLRTIPEQQVLDYIDQGQFKILSFQKNSILHMDGNECKSLEIILKGEAIVERIDESGDFMLIAELVADDVLGGNLVFSKNACYPMTITAKTDMSVLEIPRKLLLEICYANHDFLQKFLEVISERSLHLGDQLKHYVNRSIRACIIAYLKKESMVQQSDQPLLNTTKKDLAARMGVQRTSLSRELKKMKNERLIQFDADSITIMDKDMFE